ncbi:MAG: prepilin peptidase [Planctomycetia bacterium]|nr:prepilin peptidase [Planctomycetia bacterium]
MVSLGVLLLFLGVAAYTDFRWRKIYNKTVYPGIFVALIANALGTWLLDRPQAPGFATTWGLVGLSDSVIGFLACGLVMLACFLLFGIGGGDVKAMAMVGAFLGLEKGVQAMLWTFILGGAVGLTVLIWKVGAWTILARVGRQLLSVLGVKQWTPLTEQERSALAMKLFLAPMAIPAVLLVTELGDRLFM